MPDPQLGLPLVDPEPICACGTPAEFACDAQLSTGRTCSRPLCGRCTTQPMRAIVCRRGRKKRGCEHVTLDYCPEHAHLAMAPPGPDTDDEARSALEQAARDLLLAISSRSR